MSISTFHVNDGFLRRQAFTSVDEARAFVAATPERWSATVTILIVEVRDGTLVSDNFWPCHNPHDANLDKAKGIVATCQRSNGP